MPKDEITLRIDWSKGLGSLITEIPKIENPHVETVDLYPVQRLYSYIRVTFNKETTEYFLETIEPHLDQEEEKLLLLIKDTLGRTLGYEWDKLTVLDKKEYLVESVESTSPAGASRSSPPEEEARLLHHTGLRGLWKDGYPHEGREHRGHLLRRGGHTAVRVPPEVR